MKNTFVLVGFLINPNISRNQIWYNLHIRIGWYSANLVQLWRITFRAVHLQMRIALFCLLKMWYFTIELYHSLRPAQLQICNFSSLSIPQLQSPWISQALWKSVLFSPYQKSESSRTLTIRETGIGGNTYNENKFSLSAFVISPLQASEITALHNDTHI